MSRRQRRAALVQWRAGPRERRRRGGGEGGHGARAPGGTRLREPPPPGCPRVARGGKQLQGVPLLPPFASFASPLSTNHATPFRQWGPPSDLVGLKDLQTLDLSETQVTDAGLKDLAGLTNLRTLNLWNTE